MKDTAITERGATPAGSSDRAVQLVVAIAQRIAIGLALSGGGVLAMLVALTCTTVVGRSLSSLGLGPVPGDFELVELGVAFSVFSFLPWCQFTGGHARVDVLQRCFGVWGNWCVDLGSQLLMLGASSLIAWKLGLGAIDKFEYSETTFILQLPLGWGYAAALVGSVALVLVSFATLLRALVLERPWRNSAHSS